ncbi:MAG: hypothetical protein ACJ0S4_00770 [Candidatus Rariloculaceae bacterium]
MKHTIFLLTMLLVGMLQVAMAQEGPGRSLTVSELVNAGRSVASAAGMDNRFYAAAPAIGELVQDVDIVDGEGNPVNIREIATGQYTVLVTGCLT